MRGLWRLGRFRRNLLVPFWSWRLRRRCSACGRGLTVRGPLRLLGGGEIYVGERLHVTSHSDNRVEFAVKAGARLTIGNFVNINKGVSIGCTNAVTIGDSCRIGPQCVIMDSDYHGVGYASPKVGPVRLEDGVWLATRVIVLRGVTIGEGSVVGAGSVVTRSVPPHSLVAGVPARVVGVVE